MPRKKLNHRDYMFGCMVGKCPAMRDVFDFVEDAATSKDSVLILGETGTGKELVAREIHARSVRCDKPFVSVNCSAIPDTLLESELFGYEKGAFTGATGRRHGKFEFAHTGTIFLDEIGDMPIHCQAKLLRVLEDREIDRLGGNRKIRVDVRVISSTSLKLSQLIVEGKFRKDLFYRLDEASVEMPRLNDRTEDFPLLADYFISQFKAEDSPVKGISDAVLGIFLTHDWSGGVREFRNVMKKALRKARHERVYVEDLPFVLISDNAKTVDVDFDGILSLKEYEKRYIKKILDLTNWDKAKAAKLLKVERKTVYNKIQALDISPVASV